MKNHINNGLCKRLLVEFVGSYEKGKTEGAPCTGKDLDALDKIIVERLVADRLNLLNSDTSSPLEN